MEDCWLPELIAKKRDGNELTTQEISFLVKGIVTGKIEECQLGSMLMAIFLQGMSSLETSSLLDSMIDSGERLTWPEEWRPVVVDKHSTGGVGDKASLPLAPALAACGMKVPMMSGRGLGFTGGTLDKMESIPGFQIEQSQEEIRNSLRSAGCCIFGQTDRLVPADRIMYRTRDITATVESLPLIAASILSKKIAEGISALVLDVKVGRASAMKTLEKAGRLADCMVAASKKSGIKTVAVLSNMDQPLGKMIGNALEVVESLECLHGGGPDDLWELVCVLGGHLLHLAERADSVDDGHRQIADVLKSGAALKKFGEMLRCQGVDDTTVSKLCSGHADLVSALLPSTEHATELTTVGQGYVCELNALELGKICGELGGGRRNVADNVDHAVGLQLLVKVGSKVSKGMPWLRVHHNKPLSVLLTERLYNSLLISEKPVDTPPLVIGLST